MISIETRLLSRSIWEADRFLLIHFLSFSRSLPISKMAFLRPTMEPMIWLIFLVCILENALFSSFVRCSVGICRNLNKTQKHSRQEAGLRISSIILVHRTFSSRFSLWCLIRFVHLISNDSYQCSPTHRKLVERKACTPRLRNIFQLMFTYEVRLLQVRKRP